MEINDDFLAIEEALKTEDGQRFPPAAFAYVPDPDKPSTWKLRLWVSLRAKVTRRQLGRAASAFSPGGFRGQRVRIPAEDVPGVKRRIRAAYTKLGVSKEGIPIWIKETRPMRRIHTGSVFALEEKAYDAAKGEVTVTVIKPGHNKPKTRYYPKETLDRDKTVFEGAKMFKDHATKAERRSRPEGSVDKWVANLGKPWSESDGTVKAVAKVHDPDFREKLKNLSDAGILSSMGISILARGRGVLKVIDGSNTLFVEGIRNVRSVDFVTFAGAGGKVELFESAESEAEDVEVIDEKQLREVRPDLVELIESGAVKAAADAERQKGTGTMSEIEDLQKKVSALTVSAEQGAKDLKEATEAKEGAEKKLEEAQRGTARVKVQHDVAEALSKATGLPEPAKKRLTAQFKEADSSEGIHKAIDAEKEYLKEVAPKKKLTGFGESGDKELEEGEGKGEGQKRLESEFVESYMSHGDSKEEAERKAKIASR